VSKGPTPGPLLGPTHRPKGPSAYGLPRRVLVPYDNSQSLTLAPASGRKAPVASFPNGSMP
jgi:hypothetical protein